MRSSYRISEPDAKSTELAERIMKLLVDSEVTYQQADDALTVAQEMMLSKTKPVIS